MRCALLFPLLVAGCDLFGTVRATGRPVSEAYGGGHELRVLDVDSPLRPQKRVPVLSTPEILAVYVPAHAENEILIGDHWVYIRLKEPEWFVEKLQDPDPPATGDAPVEHLKPLRDLDWNRVLIPHRAAP